jgi:hypothetical protein
MSDTPETDALVDSINSSKDIIRHEFDFIEMTSLARKLERERDEALATIASLEVALDEVAKMAGKLKEERDEARMQFLDGATDHAIALLQLDKAKKTAAMLAGELAAARRDLILAKREAK